MEKVKIICLNKKARHNYSIDEVYEAGISLLGTEVKSLRDGRAHLKESYAKLKNDEIFLVNAHISPYTHAGHSNHDPVRQRKLLLHKKEIRRLAGKMTERGLTLIPLRMYFKRGKAKVELGLGKGKKLHDKREDIKKRDMARDAARYFKDKKINHAVLPGKKGCSSLSIRRGTKVK